MSDNKSFTQYRGRDKLAGRQSVATLAGEPGFINLDGNYDYLSRAYYISQDFENAGQIIRPSCQEMLDAYVPPLFLEKAQLAGLQVPEYYISNGHFDPPAIVDPINPFTLKGRVVLRPGKARSLAKSLTRNFTYAICCQELPPGSSVLYFRSILGWSVSTRYREISESLWRVFSIPLARVRVIKTSDDKLLLSDIAPLFREDLKPREIKYLEERATWVS